MIDPRLCVDIQNHHANLTYDNIPPLRITVRSDVMPPMKCIGNINLVNAVINTIKMPIILEYEKTFGRRLNDTHWTGVVGHLVSNRSDVAIGQFAATYERFQAVKFSTTLWFGSTIGILSGRLCRHSNEWDFQVLKTFSFGVWMSILVTVIAVGVTDNFIDENKLSIRQLLSHILLSYKMLLGQNSSQISWYCCFRRSLLIGICLNCFHWLMEWFRTFILANILFEPIIQIDTIDDIPSVLNLLNTPGRNVTLVAYKQHLAWHLLETSKEDNFKRVFNLLIDSQDFGYQQIYSGERVAIGFSGIFEYVIKANPQLNFHLSRELYFLSNIVSLYSKTINPSIKRTVDSVISNAYESGLQDLWLSLQYNNRLNIRQTEEKQTIEMQSIKGLISLLTITYSTIILILLIENICFKTGIQRIITMMNTSTIV